MSFVLSFGLATVSIWYKYVILGNRSKRAEERRGNSINAA